MTTFTARVYRTIPRSLRVAIVADLRSVDHDMNGMIGTEECKGVSSLHPLHHLFDCCLNISIYGSWMTTPMA